MKRKIGFFAIVIGIVLGSDLLVGAVTKKAIVRVPDVGVNQTNTVQAFFKRTSEVLILGPSTANHHFDCRILEDSLGMTCYNAGRDGQNIIYDAMVLEGYLTRCTPKLIILDMGGSMLSDDWMGNLQDFNCYYGILEPIDAIIDSIGTPLDRVKMLSGLYRYNKTWEWLLQARLGSEKAGLDGYRPMPMNRDTNFKAKVFHEKERRTFVPNRKAMHYLRHIVSRCKTLGIRLVMTNSPCLVVNLEEGSFERGLRQFCEKEGIPYMNFVREKMFYEYPELFYDMSHLNERGAEVFTREFLRRMGELTN